MPRSRSRSPVPVSGVATIIKTIGGVNVTLSKNLERLTDELETAANTAIRRLSTEAGLTGLVIITSFSHTAIIAEIQGNTRDKSSQKRQLVEDIEGDAVQVEPGSVGTTLNKVACFALQRDLNLHKLNIAGIGAKSFVDPEYIKEIIDIIKKPSGVLASTPETIANQIIKDIIVRLQPRLSKDAIEKFIPYTKYKFDSIRQLIESELKKASKHYKPGVLIFQHLSKAAQKRVIDRTFYDPLVSAVSYQFHYDNLHSGAAFRTFQTSGSCMMNKEYMRQDVVEEHQPQMDWHISAFDKNGDQLIGNMPHPLDNSWKMDLITIVKILKKTDKVTTKDILDLLYENGIRNVVFIDGGCNVFCGDGGMLACSGCHPSLDTICPHCNIRVKYHLRGGMKNKKIKKTKKKGRTVRGRRMRKSYKRYKRSKTYKR